MNNEKNRKVEKILSSLDGSQRASAPDFFYTRLKAKMEKAQPVIIKKTWVLRPAYIMTALLLILAVNAAVLLKGQNENETNTATADNETVQQSLASEYRLNVSNTMYDLNQDK